MAYVSALWNGTLKTDEFARDDARVIYIWIGYDSQLPVSYALMVEMYPTMEGTEYAFAIVERDRSARQSRAIFDSAEANSIIPKSYRMKIRELLYTTTERLVRANNRDNFFMVTFCYNLPDAALEKYRRLCEIFTRCGYEIDYSEPEHGKHLWLMNRST